MFEVSLKLPKSHRKIQNGVNHPTSHNTKHFQQAVNKNKTRQYTMCIKFSSENCQWKNESNKQRLYNLKKTGVNTPVLNWLLFSVIYLPFCSVNLTWTQQSISSNSHHNTHQSSSGCQMLLKALHGLPKTLLADKLLESNCFLKNNQDTVSSELSLIMADPENWHKFGSNCDKRSFQ